MSADGIRRPSRVPAEVVVVWSLFAAVACAILVTYSRLPARELYHVTGSGLEGGASRALVFANFSSALAVLPVLALLFDRLPGRVSRAVAVVAAILCAVVFWPGVVRQSNLDARPVNALAAGGVVLALGLTLALARRGGVARRAWIPGDRARAALVAVLVLAALPWIAADLGLFLNGVPLLGGIFQSGPYAHGAPGVPAVHHGHHHGMDGLLLVLTALLLSRTLSGIAARGLRRATTVYLALLFCYGVGNMANDFWFEQVVKRGWTSWTIPNVLEPRATVAWAIIVLAAATLAGLALARGSPSAPRQTPSSLTPTGGGA